MEMISYLETGHVGERKELVEQVPLMRVRGDVSNRQAAGRSSLSVTEMFCIHTGQHESHEPHAAIKHLKWDYSVGEELNVNFV